MAVLIYFDNIVLDWENYLHQGAWDEISESGWYYVHAYSIPCSVLGTQRSIWIKISRSIWIWISAF